jgi:predicted DNA-binding WGR domain protein
MSKLYLEYHDPVQNSHKFYEVWVEGSITKARFGRVGKHGQTKDYPNSSPGDAAFRRDELVAEKKRKGYQPVTPPSTSSAPQTPAQPVSNGYRMYWKAVSPIGPNVLAHAVQETHEILRAIQARIGGTGWKLKVTEGVGGNAYTFSYGKATERSFSFGFMPKAQYDSIKPSAKKSHDREGIAGWLSPNGVSPNGGDILTDGDYVDLAARLLLVLLRGEVPDFTVTCDLALAYGRRVLSAMPDAHASDFAWTKHWATIADVLAEQGMVGGSAGINAHLRKLSQQSTEPFVF